MTDPCKTAEPSNIEAEEAVLGMILLNTEEALPQCVDLEPHHFYATRNKELYKRMLEMSRLGKAIDLVTLTDYLKQKNSLEKIGGHIYLAKIIDSVATAANAFYYVKIIIDKHIRREIRRVAFDILTRSNEGDEDNKDIIATSVNELCSIKNERKENVNIIEKIGEDCIKDIERVVVGDLPDGTIRTQFRIFDDVYRLDPGDLHIIAGRPSMGKSSLMLQIAHQIASSGNPVLVFSLEMSEASLYDRLLGRVMKINPRNFRRVGGLNRDQTQELRVKADELNSVPLYFCDEASLTVDQVSVISQIQHKLRGISCVFVDYIQLITGYKESREQEIALISRSLKSLAKRLNIPVVALAQLNRQVEGRSDKRPLLSDLRESGSIEQDADGVVFLYMPSYYTKWEYTKREMDEELYNWYLEAIIRKQRKGSTGTLTFLFNKELGQFNEYVK
jgi:replicative DNA helicase